MFNRTRKEVLRLGQQTGFIQNKLEKVLRLMDILNQINQHPHLQNQFVLKGGTALYLFYLNMARLSIDIDLNYIGNADKGVVETSRVEISQILQDIFSNEYHVSISKDTYALTQLEFVYQTLSDTSDKLKLELNYLHRIPIHQIQYLIKEIFGEKVQFPILHIEELTASKIITLLNRYTPRDLFDVYKIVDKFTIPENDLFRQLLLFYAVVSDTSVFRLFNPDFSKITPYNLRRFLVPLLPKGEYPDAQMIIQSVRKSILPLIRLSEKEHNILSHFYKTGKIDWNQLTDNVLLANRIQQSPALQWRVQSIIKHLPG